MAYMGPSIVDYLKSIGQDSSYSARAKKAASLGIQNYTGTAAQNTQMLNALRNNTAPKTTYSAPAPATYGLDLKTGIETFSDGTQGEKFSWEADPNDPTKLYRENVATGARLGDDYIGASRPNTTTPTGTNPNQELLDRIAALEGKLTQSQNPYDIEAARGRIQDWGSNLKASLIAKIEAAKKAGLGQYANAGTLATQQTKSALDQNAIDKAKAIEQILQASEAAGQGRGGMNISGQIAANTAAQQNANLARQNLQNNLAAIEQAKADVSTQAEQSKIAAESDVEARVLQAIMDAERYATDVDLQGRALDLQNMQFNFAKELQTKQFDAEQAWREWQKQFEIENQAWQRSPDNPALQSQILANKAALLNNQLLALELQNYPEEHKLRMEQLRKEIAQIGKAPVVSDYERQMQNIKLNQAKIELENMKNGQKTDYTPFINQLYVNTDPLTGATTVDKAGIIDYLENLANSGIPQDEIRELAKKFGISM